ncbi:MAG: Y box binding protein 1 [Cyphobasidiales sp. Tagirdzhanova-0007]|nr:MAG: Y box binding protein 1 [Cyphobasidiales sp. Tagirdzhanova-0007]
MTEGHERRCIADSPSTCTSTSTPAFEEGDSTPDSEHESESSVKPSVCTPTGSFLSAGSKSRSILPGGSFTASNGSILERLDRVLPLPNQLGELEPIIAIASFSLDTLPAFVNTHPKIRKFHTSGAQPSSAGTFEELDLGIDSLSASFIRNLVQQDSLLPYGLEYEKGGKTGEQSMQPARQQVGPRQANLPVQQQLASGSTLPSFDAYATNHPPTLESAFSSLSIRPLRHPLGQQQTQHPNAPFERTTTDSLTSQLDATTLSNPNAMWPRRSGVVKFFNSTKGFGFIWDNRSSEIGDVDIFVHWTTIQGAASFKSLGEGEMVEYELGRGPKGFQALNVTGPNGSSVQGDPLARIPFSLSQNSSRFNAMSVPTPAQSLAMPGYAHSQHGHINPPISAHYLHNSRYMPQAQNAFFPVSGSALQDPMVSSFQTNVGPVGSSGRRDSSVDSPTIGSVHALAPGSAYAQYLAAATGVHQQRNTGRISNTPGTGTSTGISPSGLLEGRLPVSVAACSSNPSASVARRTMYGQQGASSVFHESLSPISTIGHHLNETSSPAEAVPDGKVVG